MRHKRGAHKRGIVPQRIDNLYAFRHICADLCIILRAGERIGHTFKEAHVLQVVLQDICLCLELRYSPAAQAGQRICLRDIVVAVNARHLFGNIGRTIDIAAERGNGAYQLVANDARLDKHAVQVLLHFLCRNIRSKLCIDTRRVDLDYLLLEVLIQHVDHAVCHFARPKLTYKRERTLHGKHRRDRIHSLGKAHGAFRRKAQAARGLADISIHEFGGFKYDRFRLVRNFRIEAAHHARNADRSFLIANEQHIFRKGALFIVERLHFFAILRTADDDLAAADFGGVERVHRLSRFEHDKVCDIHDIVDRTYARFAQAQLDPLGGRFDLNVRYCRRNVARTQVRRLDLDTDQFLCFGFVFFVFHFRQAERHLVGGGRLARRADHRKAVGPVRADFKINDRPR